MSTFRPLDFDEYEVGAESNELGGIGDAPIRLGESLSKLFLIVQLRTFGRALLLRPPTCSSQRREFAPVFRVDVADSIVFLADHTTTPKTKPISTQPMA